MALAIAEYLAAVTHLPPGAVLRVDDVPWEEYERLLADLGEGYAVRIFYDRGRMEIVAPTSTHERAKSIVHALVMALADELDVDIESLGSTTLRAQVSARGAEPDDCFYVQNARLVIGKREDLDLDRDPPPDLVVEIERTSASLDKFPIYAALGVPEIWRVIGREVRVFRLAPDRYEESPTSRAFSFLTAHVLSAFVEQGLAEGRRGATRAFRAWIREHRGPTPEAWRLRG